MTRRCDQDNTRVTNRYIIPIVVNHHEIHPCLSWALRYHHELPYLARLSSSLDLEGLVKVEPRALM
jgi:hypothetical protein